MNIQNGNRKYTLEYCQQFIGQIIGCVEILNVYYKQIGENWLRTYATCRCIKCGRITEKLIERVIRGYRASCICNIAENGKKQIHHANQAWRNRMLNYNKWEYIDPNTVRVYFSDGTYFIADTCSWMWLRRFVWRKSTSNHKKSNPYAVTALIDGGGNGIPYHTALLSIPPFNKTYVRDHINQNSSDNRYNNLRVVDHRVNVINSKHYENKDYICYNDYPIGIVKIDNKYVAQMSVYGARKRRYFDTLEEAIEQRKDWETQYNTVIPLEVPRLFLPDGSLNLKNFRFDWYDDRYWWFWHCLGINLLPIPKQEYLRYMPTKDVIDFGYNGVYL